MEILTILAIIIGPIAAVQIEKQLQRSKSNRERKTSIFKTLMATRGTVLSYTHVEALNRIDLEFSDDKKYDKVISCWKEYFDNLSQKVTEENVQVWSSKNEELLSNLLYEMGKSLGYSFDKILIKRNVYSPVAHGTVEREMQVIRKGFLELLNGERNIPFEINQEPEILEKQKELQEAMIEYYKRTQNSMLTAKIILGIGTLIGILLFKKTKPLFLRILLLGFVFSYCVGYYVEWPLGTISFMSFGVFVLAFLIWSIVKRNFLYAIISLFVMTSFIFAMENYPYSPELGFSMIIPISIHIWIFKDWRKHLKGLSILIILFSYEIIELISVLEQWIK